MSERAERLLRHWDELVDPRVGIVHEVEALPVDDDEPNFFHYLATTSNTGAFTALANFRNTGGVSTNRYDAIAKAIGESIERYCSAIFRYADLRLAAFEDLDEPAVSPRDFALFTEDQYADPDFPWRPVSTSSPLAWTAGTSLVTGERVLVPAATVYVPYHYLLADGEVPFVQPISTGLAAGGSFAEAALSGLCEAVERDAFTITWQARLARPRIALEGLPPSVADLVARYHDARIGVELIDITTDIGVPTVLSFALSTAETSPALAVAAATSPSPEVAAIKSLEELAHTRKFSRQLLDYAPPVDVGGPDGFNAIETQRDHLRFYCEQSSVPYAEFAWSSSEWVKLGDLAAVPVGTAEEQLAAMVGRVAGVGLDVIACDLTTPDIAELGLAVVRVVVPGAHPLFMGFRTRSRAGARLYSVPARLGLPGPAPGEPDNPYPHPFP